MKNKNTIFKTISQYKPIEKPEAPESAAVLIILLEENADQDLEIVLTKRAADLPSYAGDVSFPGGMRDSTDQDLYRTAKREVQEELSLPLDSYQFIGQLDDFSSRDGHLVRPFVVSMQKSDFEKLCQKSDREIEETVLFPLRKLADIRDEPLLHPITLRVPSFVFIEEEVFIWGLTAAILAHLREVLNIH